MSNKSSIILLTLLSFTALFFSFYRIIESPPVWYDEGWYIQTAANLEKNNIDGIQLAPGNIHHVSILTVGYPLIYPLALWFKLFGVNIFSARLLMIILMLGFMTAAYFFARKMWTSKIALYSLSLLVFLPTLYGNGKSVLGEVPGLLYFLLFLIFFSTALLKTNNKIILLIIGGFFAGLSVVTKPIFLLVIPSITIGIFLEWRRGTLRFSEILSVSISGLAPIIVWFYVQFLGETSFARVLMYYANPYEIKNMMEIILKNIWSLFSDIGTLYLTTIMALWILSLWMRIRTKIRISSNEIVSFSFCTLIIAGFLRTAGWYRYLFPAQAISLIFLPTILTSISVFLSNKFFVLRSFFKWSVPMIILALSLFGGYQILFDSWVADSYKSQKSAFWEEYFSKTSQNKILFFFDTPEVAVFVTSSNYYQYLSPAGIIIGEEGLLAIDSGLVDIIILRTDRWDQVENTERFKHYRVDREVYKYTILEKKLR